MAPLHEKYELRVTAGSTYDRTKHSDVLVNTEKPLHISSDLIDAQIHVRIKDYRGLPKSSPSTSPYFSTPQHPYDRYSISFSFVPKHDIAGDALVFGNDFEHPIRDRLPPLFDKAFGIVKWWIDPGLEGDVYGDEPYLYGALLSSINVLRIGEKKKEEEEEAAEKKQGKADAAYEDVPAGTEGEAVVYTEGADGSGEDVRRQHNIPGASAARQKFFLTEANRKNFTFEKGRQYQCDFFNPYLDFNEFALKIGYGLPNISIIGHWDGQPLRPHSLRYTLKNKATNTELFVVVIQLCPTEEAVAEGAKSAEQEFEEVHGVKQPTAGGDEDLD
ncbi:F-box domain containing protein [Stagonosporopsis vannaccii]|nr:F-box domain containing protein [Stagonosporopsis vannaccii]